MLWYVQTCARVCPYPLSLRSRPLASTARPTHCSLVLAPAVHSRYSLMWTGGAQLHPNASSAGFEKANAVKPNHDLPRAGTVPHEFGPALQLHAARAKSRKWALSTIHGVVVMKILKFYSSCMDLRGGGWGPLSRYVLGLSGYIAIHPLPL